MNRSLPVILCAVATATGQAPLPTPASFAWDSPKPMDNVAHIAVEWPGGSTLLDAFATNYTVADFPRGVASPVGAYSVSAAGLTSDTNVIYVLNIRAVLEEANDPAGPWTPGPDARILYQRQSPQGFVRVRLELQ